MSRPSSSVRNIPSSSKKDVLPPPVLVYHESARSIVFRDHLRRQAKNLATTNSRSSSVSSSPSRDRSPSPVVLKSKKYSSSSSSSSKEWDSVPQSIGGPTVYDGDTGNELKSSEKDSQNQVIIAGFTPVIDPLPALELGPSDPFEPLAASFDDDDEKTCDDKWTEAEREVVEFLRTEKAVVKTIRNSDWTAFLRRFVQPVSKRVLRGELRVAHADRAMDDEAKTRRERPTLTFNSFMTSTSLLPSSGKKMRCFGSLKEYGAGVIFALPAFHDNNSEGEDESYKRTHTWSWPSGYSAKTEFNIDEYGRLINGRKEALVPMSGMRKSNHSYLHDKDFVVAGKLIKGGLNTVPYNEVFLRVGGVGRIVRGAERGKSQKGNNGTDRTLEHGVGLPIALFARQASYKDLVALLRTKSRFVAAFGRERVGDLPLLVISPDRGARVLTSSLQKELLQTMARELNPFQNVLLAHKTSIDRQSEPHMQQKMEELLDLDSDDIRSVLTPEECARVAGGFGATDDSVANLLMDAMREDMFNDRISDQNHHSSSNNEKGIKHGTEQSHRLQDVVNEGLTSAVRAGDYNTSRQLLILYSLVASRCQKQVKEECRSLLPNEQDETASGGKPRKKDDETGYESDRSNSSRGSRSSYGRTNSVMLVEKDSFGDTAQSQQRNFTKELSSLSDGTVAESTGRNQTLSKDPFPSPPPPPPLDTDRLRSATNSDGLLAVLGAAQLLKAMQDGGAQRRVEEAVDAIDEWIRNGEQSVAFRLASWRDLRAAQGDLQIATENESNFMAFVSNKAISNRKKFAKQLRDAVSSTDFENVFFLKSIHDIVSGMHSPCLRLELLQYILGLDNRYSVAHVARSVELAATCMNISMYEHEFFDDASGVSNHRLEKL